MDIEVTTALKGTAKALWQDFLARAELECDTDAEQTVLIWDNGELVATGSRQGNLLKYIAVSADRQGEGLTATVLTQLRQEAFRQGHKHLFLYTKPQNAAMFTSLFFYPIAQTDKVLLMEDKQNGIRDFLASLPVETCDGIIGAAVMNCNPFTKGHRYLIETAAKECDHVYVFVLSEDLSEIPAKDRLEMVRLGTTDLPNVTVLTTGPYLISSATFPTYFLKERDKASEVHCLLDIEIFTKYFAPKFHITRRYVGTEPLSAMTNQYNEALKAHLPSRGIAVREIPRLEIERPTIRTTQAGSNHIRKVRITGSFRYPRIKGHRGAVARISGPYRKLARTASGVHTVKIPISASTVRAHIRSGNSGELESMLPETTRTYLSKRGMLK